MNLCSVLLAFILFDASIHYLLHCALLHFYPFSNISFIWLLTCIRFPLTCIATVELLKKWDTRPGCVGTLHAFLYSVVLCFTSPTYELWKQKFLLKSFEFHSVLHLSLLMYLVSATAALFWETVGLGETSLSGQKTEDDAENEEKEKKAAKATFRRLFIYSRPDVIPLCGAFTFLTAAVIMETFIPYYTGKVIDILGSKFKQDEFFAAIFFMALYSMGSSVSAGLRGGLFMFTLFRLTQRIRNLLFGSLVKQDIGFFDFTRTGDLTSRLSVDTALMSRSIAANVNIFLRSLVKTLGIYYFMFSLSWQLTLLTFIESPVSGMFQKLYNQYNQKLVQSVQDSIATSNDLAGEVVSSIKTVRSFATEDDESLKYNVKLNITHKLKMKRDTARATLLFVQRLIQLAMQVVMLYYGQNLIREGRMSSGNLVAFILYQMDLGSYIRTLVYIYGDMILSVGAAEKVFEYLDRQPNISNDGKLKSDKLKGHVRFNNVSFSYPTRPELQVLKNVSFELKSGEVTALVGPSGGGKSTCVSLLERFYEPQSGEILLDEKPLSVYDHKFLHSKISLVGQEPVLFATTVRENISYGLSNCSTEDISAAAVKANAYHFIQGLAKRYDTDVGEKGGQLSGGQKQRIAIARALIRNPQILILDEATSCLDIESEHMIQEALSEVKEQTVLVIAHRLKTVEKADKIIVIIDGSVIEEGTHTELMKNEGCYYRLVQRVFDQNGDHDNNIF
ncbi:antigen peptide transporter 2-like [Protopterus annectens]|uniref:antigen peptide transporter 2-like n=1 Tax=Protopterus annectens TaxID=7888 RepID=UPI001CFA49D0|nr:antigen peptide transporter 2-like [Protopterus annectens]